MLKRSKMPRDPNELAKMIEATEQSEIAAGALKRGKYKKAN